MFKIKKKIEDNTFVADPKKDKGEFCASFDFAWLNAIEEFKRNLDLVFSGKQEKLPTDEITKKINELKLKIATNPNPLKEFFGLIADVMEKNNETHNSPYIKLFCESIKTAAAADTSPAEALETESTAEALETESPAEALETESTEKMVVDKKLILNVFKIIDIGKYTLNKSSHFDRNAFLAAGDLFGELLGVKSEASDNDKDDIAKKNIIDGITILIQSNDDVKQHILSKNGGGYKRFDKKKFFATYGEYENEPNNQEQYTEWINKRETSAREAEEAILIANEKYASRFSKKLGKGLKNIGKFFIGALLVGPHIIAYVFTVGELSLFGELEFFDGGKRTRRRQKRRTLKKINKHFNKKRRTLEQFKNRLKKKKTVALRKKKTVALRKKKLL